MTAEIDWQRMYLDSVRTYGDLGIGVMQRVAEGATLAEVLEFVADHLDGRDHVDEESIAIYERAKAAAGGSATPGPTREQVLKAIEDNVWRSRGREHATDAVLALFGRSAPEPPADDGTP